MRGLTDYIPSPTRSLARRLHPLTVLPNNRCNFACSYCYSAGSRNTAEIEPDVLRMAIDYFIDTKRTRPSRHQAHRLIHGRRRAHAVVAHRAQRHNLRHWESRKRRRRSSLPIVTYGSILTDEQIEFILNHRIGLSISFEVLPECRTSSARNFPEQCRPTSAAHSPPASTHPAQRHRNQAQRPPHGRNLRHHAAHLPGCENAMFEPVTAQNLFDTPADMEDFYNAYLRRLYGNIPPRARRRRGDYLIPLPPHCLSPAARLVPASSASRPKASLRGATATAAHPLFGRTHYGNVYRDIVKLDMETYRDLTECNVDTNPECAVCSARWNCGGGCFHLVNSYDLEYRDAVCRFTRRFVEAITRYRAYYES